VREDIEKGVYVKGLKEVKVTTTSDAEAGKEIFHSFSVTQFL